MQPTFHLSIGVRSLEESKDFFVRVWQGNVAHEDPSSYVNVVWGGCQITLQREAGEIAVPPGLHFGVNLPLEDFEHLAMRVQELAPAQIVMPSKVAEANTSLERKKMYLRCPSGYLIEIKGYRSE